MPRHQCKTCTSYHFPFVSVPRTLLPFLFQSADHIRSIWGTFYKIIYRTVYTIDFCYNTAKLHNDTGIAFIMSSRFTDDPEAVDEKLLAAMLDTAVDQSR